MFDNIARTYDFLNHFLSFGIDRNLRRRAIKFLSAELQTSNPKILDVACGTGDFSIEALRLNPSQVIGIDISEKMLWLGNEKMKKNNLSGKISLQYGDCENLDFADNFFDAVIVAYGVRNFENMEKGLLEIFRVLKPKGVCTILEFSTPKNIVMRKMFRFYFGSLLPVFGRMISGDKNAYSYLGRSIREFPGGETFLGICRNIGFKETKCFPLAAGISSVYLGRK